MDDLPRRICRLVADGCLGYLGSGFDRPGMGRIVAASEATDDAGRRGNVLFHEVREAIDDGRTAEARRLAEAGRPQAPDHIRLTDALIALRRHDGEVAAAFDLAVHNARRRRDRLAARRRVDGPEPALEPEQRVFISGYFYSGSGAVVDFLTDHRGCDKWSPAGEMRLIKFPGGLDDIATRHANSGTLSAEALVDLYLHLCGRRIVTTPADEYHQVRVVNRHSRRLHRASTARGYLLRCYERFLHLADHVDDPALTTSELERELREWVRVALDAAAHDLQADRLVIDQAITAWRLPAARLAPPSTFVVVHRDPRDQFVEARQALSQPGRRPPGVTPFAVNYLRRRLQVKRWIPMLQNELGHRIVACGFERFVMEHAETGPSLLDALGLADRERHGSDFEVSQSRVNVAKHPTELTRHEQRVLRLLLRRYLDDHAGG